MGELTHLCETGLYHQTFHMKAEEWEAAFAGLSLPQTATLDKGVTIIDIPVFLQTSLAILRSNQPPRVTDPVELRLRKLLELLTER